MNTLRLTSIPRVLSACLAACALLYMPGANAAFDPPTVDLAHLNGYVYPTPNTGPGVNSTYNGGVINNAIFRADSTQPAGTGVFNPFLRVQVTGSGTPKEAPEQGYNTSYSALAVFDDKTPVNWTHDVKFADLDVVTENGVAYYKFKLDINEPASSPNSLLSLDGLRLFSSTAPSQNSTNTFNGSGTQPGDWDYNGGTSAGKNTLLWDMDAGGDNYVLLDGNRNGGGSGIADMVALFKKVDIDAARAAGNMGDYLILWSRFGLNDGAYDKGDNSADGGFEEWSFQSKSGTCTNCGGGSAPVPGTLLLVALGLGLLIVRSRRFDAPRFASA